MNSWLGCDVGEKHFGADVLLESLDKIIQHSEFDRLGWSGTPLAFLVASGSSWLPCPVVLLNRRWISGCPRGANVAILTKQRGGSFLRRYARDTRLR
jgi:hypothetical protein